jgi:hypothetical protein
VDNIWLKKVHGINKDLGKPRRGNIQTDAHDTDAVMHLPNDPGTFSPAENRRLVTYANQLFRQILRCERRPGDTFRGVAASIANWVEYQDTAFAIYSYVGTVPWSDRDNDKQLLPA